MFSISTVGGYFSRYVFERVIVVRYFFSLYARRIGDTSPPSMLELGCVVVPVFVTGDGVLVTVKGTEKVPT